MPKFSAPKTVATYRYAKPRSQDYLISDGGGLCLLVRPGGTKRWIFRYRFGGVAHKVTLPGRFPTMSVQQARKLADEYRRLLAEGVDPKASRTEEQVRQSRRVVAERQERLRRETFEQVAIELIETRMAGMEALTRKVAEDRLRRDVLPILGKRSIAEITAPELLEVLRRIEKRGKTETAPRILSLCSRVFRYGVATSRVERDITSDLKGALRPARASNRASLTDPADFAALLRDIWRYQGWYATRFALQLLAIFATRPGELRLARWDEINWTPGQERLEIPASRMKMRIPHIVPLSRQALEILRRMKAVTKSDVYLFPSPLGQDRPLSNVTILKALRRMGYSNGEMCAHGFRAAFRTIGAEHLGMKVLALEAQLAHRVQDPLGTAYNRSTYIEDRRSIMQAWSDWVEQQTGSLGVAPGSDEAEGHRETSG